VARPGPVRLKLHALASSAAVPLAVHLELTQRCNLRCCHCYVDCGDYADETPEVSIERWVELVGELRDAGCMTVVLTGGEVGLRAGWLTVAKAVRDNGLMLAVLTNGTAMTTGELHELVRLRPVRVAVSLYGPTAEVHEAVTRTPGSFERTVATMTFLREQGIRVRASVVLMQENFSGYQSTRELAWSLDCEPVLDFTIAPRANGDTDVLTHRLTRVQLEELLRDVVAPLLESWEPERGDDVPARLRKVGSCGAGATGGFVAANGDLFPCVGFLPSFGNVGLRPFVDVWTSPAARAHRLAMARTLDACTGCQAMSTCITACPRRSLAENGDMSAAAEWTCLVARVLRDLQKESKKTA
jgi:radical SAM protein with 4Fe4S-binding SPASM domain